MRTEKSLGSRAEDAVENILEELIELGVIALEGSAYGIRLVRRTIHAIRWATRELVMVNATSRWRSPQAEAAADRPEEDRSEPAPGFLVIGMEPAGWSVDDPELGPIPPFKNRENAIMYTWARHDAGVTARWSDG